MQLEGSLTGVAGFGDVAPAVRFRCLSRRPMASLRVFCFPHAGGGASIYRDWGSGLPHDIEVLAAQLPGREDRLGEAAPDDWSELVRGALDGMRPHAGLPCVLFGHSFGAVLAFEVARALHRQGAPHPRCLVVSGRSAPAEPSPGVPPLADLPDEEMLRRLEARYGSSPSGGLAHPEIRQLVLPALRSDVGLLERYRREEGPLLECAIVALGGEDDPSVSPGQLAGWKAETRGPFRARALPGGHFFIESARPEVLAEIARAALLEGAA